MQRQGSWSACISTLMNSTENQKFWSRRTICSRRQLTWVLYGPGKGNVSPPTPKSAVSQDNLLKKMVSDYFITKIFGVSPASPGAVDAGVRPLSILEDRTKWVGRRYQTELLWKTTRWNCREDESSGTSRIISVLAASNENVEESRCPRYYFCARRVWTLQLHVFVDST